MKSVSITQADTATVSPEDDFNFFYQSHHAMLRRVAYMLCGDAHLANDLTQEAWIRAWRAYDTLRDMSAAKSWLIIILKREHARLYERKRVDTQTLNEEIQVPDKDAAPETMIFLRQLLDGMDANEREPLLMQALEGYSSKEIAKVRGVSRNAMTIRLHRTRKRLQQIHG